MLGYQQMDAGSFYPYALFILVTSVASMHLFRLCGHANPLCRVLYVLGLGAVLYVILETVLEQQHQPQPVPRRQLVIQFALLALVLAMFTHKPLWQSTCR
jgi:hypothetical protein